MTAEQLLGELQAIRQAVAQRERALLELGFQVSTLLDEVDALEQQLRSPKPDLRAANQSIEQLLGAVSIPVLEEAAKRGPDVTFEEFLAALEAIAPKAPPQARAAC